MRDRLVSYAAFNDESAKWEVSELRTPNPQSVDRFSEQDLWICYGVKPSEGRSGSLTIKVIRIFEGVDSAFFNKTNLYRGSGFRDASGHSLSKYEATVSRQEYRAFHEQGRISPTIRRFHAHWDKGTSSFTLKPDWRRSLFLFPPEEKGTTSSHTSYLLRYETTEQGSWIPFFIGTGGRHVDSLRRVVIVITDLGGSQPDREVEVIRILVRRN